MGERPFEILGSGEGFEAAKVQVRRNLGERNYSAKRVGQVQNGVPAKVQPVYKWAGPNNKFAENGGEGHPLKIFYNKINLGFRKTIRGEQKPPKIFESSKPNRPKHLEYF